MIESVNAISTHAFPAVEFNSSIFRQKSSNYNINDVKEHEILPINTGTCLITPVPVNRNLVRRNAYSANLLRRTKLIIERQISFHKQQMKSDIVRNSKEEIEANKIYHDGDGVKKEKTEHFKEEILQEPHQNVNVNVGNRIQSKISFKKKLKQKFKSKKGATRLNEKLPTVPPGTSKQQLKWKQSYSSITCLPVVKSTKSTSKVKNDETISKKIKLKVVVAVSPQKRTKIYYSERQSLDLNGTPGVPPCTPDVASVLEESVAYLSDIKSQRSMKQKLLKLEQKRSNTEQKKAKKVKEKEKERQAIEREQLIRRQRQMIYEFNKIMTEYEEEQFETFKHQQDGAPV